MFSRRQVVHRAVLIFRRERGARSARPTLAHGAGAVPEAPAAFDAELRESNDERRRLSAERAVPAMPRRNRPSGTD